MTHSICTSDSGGALPYFQRLWRTLLAPNIDPKTKLEQLFEHETAEFGLDYAFLSRIDLENETERFEIVRGSHTVLNPETIVPLAKTYCRKTIAHPEGTLAVSDAPAEGWEDDPAYETFGLGSYLGTTVSLDDNLYGTLCFANTAVRDKPIKDKEKTLIEMHGQWVEHAWDRWNRPPILETRVDTIEGHAVSSEAINTMMDALKNPPRRSVLMTLLGAPTGTNIATLERQIPHENIRMRLYHSDLPRLVTAGYIEWDNDSDTISRGPKFSEVEPLVQLLKEYNSTLPE